MVADVIDAARSMGQSKYLDWGPGGADITFSPDELSDRWYVRAHAPGAEVRARFGEVQFLARPGATGGEAAFLTGPYTRPELDRALAGLTVDSVIRMYH